MATKREKAVEELRPQEEEVAKKDLSGFKIKDKHFNKIKTYLEKNKKGNEQKEMLADWRNINISGNQMVVFKGKELSKKQHSYFNKEQKEYWLDKV